MQCASQNRPGTWAPKALAIVSFALAMLANQPAVISGAVERSGVAVVKEVSGPSMAEPRLTPVTATPAKRNRTVEALPKTHLHILATVEILQRLLIAELEVRPDTMWMAYVPNLEHACVGILPPASSVILTCSTSSDDSPPPSERVFAIAHCLLAPPIV